VKPADVKYLVVHCSATPADMDIGVKEIDRWHKAKGWAGCGYHFVIRRDGTIENGRALHIPGAHVEGYNTKSLGICLVGGLSADGQSAEDNFTAIQRAMLRSKLNYLKAGDYRVSEVMGHRDFPGVKKDCPSFNVRMWY
jgi:N-acetyl-anhydromuramyl-L-alanine amidase AmpD